MRWFLEGSNHKLQKLFPSASFRLKESIKLAFPALYVKSINNISDPVRTARFKLAFRVRSIKVKVYNNLTSVKTLVLSIKLSSVIQVINLMFLLSFKFVIKKPTQEKNLIIGFISHLLSINPRIKSKFKSLLHISDSFTLNLKVRYVYFYL